MADLEREEEFEKIFDEAVETDGAGQTSTETKPNEQQTEDAQAENKAQGEADTSQTQASGTEDGNEQKSSDENDAKGEASDDKTKEDQGDKQIPYEKLLQQKKSLEGMFNSNQKKVKELEDRLKELSASQTTDGDTSKSSAEGAEIEPEQKKSASQQTGLQAYEENEQIKAFIDDFPDIHNGIQEIMKYEREAVKKSFEAFARIIAPVLQDRFASTVEKRDSTIIKTHSDFSELKNNGALNQWISELPSFKRQAYAEVLDNGDPSDVIEVLNEFKKAHGTMASSDNSVVSEAAMERARKLKNSEGIKSKTGPVSGRNSVAGKDDYVGAFEEAIRIG